MPDVSLCLCSHLNLDQLILILYHSLVHKMLCKTDGVTRILKIMKLFKILDSK